MRNLNTPPSTTKSLQLARGLAEQGYRLFSLNDARETAEHLKLEMKDMKGALASLKTQGWIHSLKRDLYCLDTIFLGGQSVHEFEIATHLVTPSAISHFSAFHYHGLTDQIPQTVFAMTLTGTALPRVVSGELYAYRGVEYHYIQVKKAHFFGIEEVWMGEARVPITNLERTLLDGLMKPKYCGGIQEVLSAYSSAQEVNMSQLIEYVLRLDTSVAKRLGWVLEHIGTDDQHLDSLQALPFAGYIKLDPSGKKEGPYNKRWQIQENI